ncbi:laminin subunit alpha-5-like [Ictidomys tridecemlineatus]
MAPRDARLRTRSALGAGGPRGPAPLLLAGLVLLGAARARAPEDGDFSLHPPYFNLAEGARISASATCGEEAPARGPPRPTEDLYCKLVGGPVAGGDPNQTIQGQYCDICTAAQSNKAHPVSNAIDGTERWWQSPPLSRGLEYNEVNVTLDLGQVGPSGPVQLPPCSSAAGLPGALTVGKWSQAGGQAQTGLRGEASTCESSSAPLFSQCPGHGEGRASGGGVWQGAGRSAGAWSPGALGTLVFTLRNSWPLWEGLQECQRPG